MPWHRVLDQASEVRLGALQIGTTRRGIGPAYADKAARVGIRVQDLLDSKILREKIDTALELKNEQLGFMYGIGRLDAEAIQASAARHAERLAPFIADVSLLVNEALDRGEDVLCEGAQGTLARPRSRHLSVRDVVEPDRGRRLRRARHGPDARRRGRGRGQGLPHARGRGPVPERGRARGRRGPARGRRRVRHRDRAAAPLRLARPRRPALRGACQRLHRDRADEARRALGRAGDPGLRRLSLPRRHGQRALPRTPVRLPPRRAGVGDARRAGPSRSTARGTSRTCRPRRSATWRSSPSAWAFRSVSSASASGAIRC